MSTLAIWISVNRISQRCRRGGLKTSHNATAKQRPNNQADHNQARHLPRKELRPLDQSQARQDRQQWPRACARLSARDEVAYEVWRHGRGEEKDRYSTVEPSYTDTLGCLCSLPGLPPPSLVLEWQRT